MLSIQKQATVGVLTTMPKKTKKKQLPVNSVNSEKDVDSKTGFRADGTAPGQIPRSGSGRQYGYY